MCGYWVGVSHLMWLLYIKCLFLIGRENMYEQVSCKSIYNTPFVVSPMYDIYPKGGSRHKKLMYGESFKFLNKVFQ